MDIVSSDIFQSNNADDLAHVLRSRHESELVDKINKKRFYSRIMNISYTLDDQVNYLLANDVFPQLTFKLVESDYPDKCYIQIF